MNKKYGTYARELFRRLIVVLLLILLSYSFHRLLTSIDQDFIGAIIFVVIFTAGLLFYYINLFHNKSIHIIEFILSIMFVFFFTILLFAIIYAEPSDNSKDVFIQNSQKSNLTFSDAFYFSTTTITTLGYGDIMPLGVFRYFVIAEVLLGLIYTGVILFFITQAMEKYRKLV